MFYDDSWKLEIEPEQFLVLFRPGKFVQLLIRSRNSSSRFVRSLLETHFFWGQQIKRQGHEAQKTVLAWVLHFYECWLLLFVPLVYHVIMGHYMVELYNWLCMKFTVCYDTFEELISVLVNAATFRHTCCSRIGKHWCMMFVDDIPVRGFIGRLEEGNFIPHTHKVLFFMHHVFNIEYNEDQVNSLFLLFLEYLNNVND